ncbi:LysR family transcriptional regulator [Chelativorans sp. Marseille-P2723]|uniref:LysR family transcriptional regulator n=1 Tax=Chelativorans sp. Marseille-P2723 TaxID=2709133 RepID=UPI00156EBEB5|nr:LysR family transcriptional regulator [Chelativorans sp. Marseille-P2723]
MNWDDIRVFLAVARAGQILGAARRLDLNHATVSRRIAALEQAIGAKLFRRLTTGTELTRAGGRLLVVAERMEADMISARAEIADEATKVAGTVRISAPDGFGVAFLAPRLWRLSMAHPELTLQLVPVPRSFSLSRREADIAITVDRPTEGRLIASKLVDYSLKLYASKSYATVHGLPEDAAGLSRHRLVGYVPDLVISPSLDYADEVSQSWSAAFSVSAAMGQVEAVRAGAGIGILHTFIARSYDDLLPVPFARPIRRSYWLVYHESMRPTRRIQAAAAFIGDLVEKEKSIFL